MDQSLFVDIFHKSNETLQTEDNEFRRYEFNPKDFFKVAAVWFGKTASGKSFHLNYVLFNMRHYFPRVIVWCPTNELNHDYKDKVNDGFMYTDLTEENFVRVMSAQIQVAEMYRNKVNNMINLRALFNICASEAQQKQLHDIDSMLQSVFTNIDQSADAPNIKSQKKKDIKDRIDEQLITYLKNCIIPHRQSIDPTSISASMLDTLKHIDINPNTLFIFDDCQEEIVAITKKKTGDAPIMFKNMFTKGRHYCLTHYYTFQDDVALPTMMRKNTGVFILTQAGIADTFIKRPTNGIDKESQHIGISLKNELFGDNDHRKIIYFSGKNGMEKFQYHIAEPSGMFLTGSSIVNNFCDEVKRKNI